MTLTMLEQAWLEELGVLAQFDSFNRVERRSWKMRAQSAAARVKANFRELQRDGRMQEIVQDYKLHKKTTERPMGWNLFALHRQVEMIRALAREQIVRADRGRQAE